MDYIIDNELLNKILSLGGVKTLRAVHYKNLVINNDYLISENIFLRYCSRIAFDNTIEKNKRIMALKLSTKIVNYSK